MYPICQTSDKSGLPNLQTNGICQTSDKLTWSHICELVTIDDQFEREFYEKECISAVATGTGDWVYFDVPTTCPNDYSALVLRWLAPNRSVSGFSFLD